MLQIRNVSKGLANEARVTVQTAWTDSGGAMPLRIDLAPGEMIEIPAQSMHDWLVGVKQWLAEYVAHGILKIHTITSVHDYQDKGHNAIYGLDHLIDAKFGPLALSHAVQMGVTLNTEVEAHFADIAVHGAVAGGITAAVPSDLATLLTWLTDVQAEFATHGASAAAHTLADTWNVLTPVVAADLATAIAALQELHRVYHSHKKWSDPTSALEMNLTTLLAY